MPSEWRESYRKLVGKANLPEDLTSVDRTYRAFLPVGFSARIFAHRAFAVREIFARTAADILLV